MFRQGDSSATPTSVSTLTLRRRRRHRQRCRRHLGKSENQETPLVLENLLEDTDVPEGRREGRRGWGDGGMGGGEEGGRRVGKATPVSALSVPWPAEGEVGWGGSNSCQRPFGAVACNSLSIAADA